MLFNTVSLEIGSGHDFFFKLYARYTSSIHSHALTLTIILTLILLLFKNDFKLLKLCLTMNTLFLISLPLCPSLFDLSIFVGEFLGLVNII